MSDSNPAIIVFGRTGSPINFSLGFGKNVGHGFRRDPYFISVGAIYRMPRFAEKIREVPTPSGPDGTAPFGGVHTVDAEQALKSDRQIYLCLFGMAVIAWLLMVTTWSEIVSLVLWSAFLSSVVDPTTQQIDPADLPVLTAKLLWAVTAILAGLSLVAAMLFGAHRTAILESMRRTTGLRLGRKLTVRLDDESDILAFIKSIEPRVRIRHVERALSSSIDTAMRGDTLILSNADFDNWSVMKEPPRRAAKLAARRDRKAELTSVILHEFSHVACRENRLAHWFAALVLLSALATGVMVAFALARLVPTLLSAVLAPAVFIFAILAAFLLHRTAKALEVHSELRANAYALFRTGASQANVDASAQNDLVLMRSYPSASEHERFMMDPEGIGSMRAAASLSALLTMAVLAISAREAFAALLPGASHSVPQFILFSFLTVFCFGAGQALPDKLGSLRKIRTVTLLAVAMITPVSVVFLSNILTPVALVSGVFLSGISFGPAIVRTFMIKPKSSAAQTISSATRSHSSVRAAFFAFTKTVHEICRYAAFAFGLFFSAMMLLFLADENRPPLSMDGSLILTPLVSAALFATFLFKRSYIALAAEAVCVTLLVVMVSFVSALARLWIEVNGMDLADAFQGIAAGRALMYELNALLNQVSGDPGLGHRLVEITIVMVSILFLSLAPLYGMRMLAIRNAKTMGPA